MATVQIFLTTTIEVDPFTGYKEPLSEASGGARGQVLCKVKDGAIAATAAGDNQQIVLRTTLPQNFAYVLLDVNIQIRTVTAATFNVDLRGSLNAFDAITVADRTIDVPIGMESSGSYTSNTNLGVADYKAANPYCWAGS